MNKLNDCFIVIEIRLDLSFPSQIPESLSTPIITDSNWIDQQVILNKIYYTRSLFI